jgi:predicted flap endonuclease-1-like 5' DNA nuclease
MTLRLSGDPQGLRAERDRLEELLQTSDDWRALLQLKGRRERGEELSSLSSSQLEALLLDSLAENPFYQRLQVVLAELKTVSAPSAAVAAPRAAPTIAAEPAAEPVDDLTKIRGIDAALMRRLHALDVWTYEDIADWWAADVHYVSQTLGIGSRISAQNWIEQAAMLSMARPDGPRQSKKAIAAAKAKAEAEAKAKAEAERLAAEAKLREAAEAKARAEAARIAEQQRIAAEAAAKKVAEAAGRIAAEAKAAAAARAEAEIAARARADAERRNAEVRRQEEAARLEAARRADEARHAEAARQAETAHAAVRAAKPGPEAQTIDVRPIVIEAVGSQSTSTPDAGTGPVISVAATLPSGLEALMKDFATKTPPAPAHQSSQATAEINIPRPVAETILKAGAPAMSEAMSDTRESLSARLRTIDAEVIEAVPGPKAPEANVNAPTQPARPALNPSASIDDAIRSAMMAAIERVHGAVSPSTELAARESTDPQSRTENGQRGELLLPISREPSPEHMALKVRERRSDDLAEVIFDSTRYAAYRDKPEEANVSIVRRNRRDVSRVLPPPVPTAQIEARQELKSAGTVDRFLKALKGL